MADQTPVPASGTVHWIGTGLSTGSGLRVLADHAQHLTLYGRTVPEATACLEGLGLTDRVEARALDLDDLSARVRPGDILVSMLPADRHPGLLRLSTAAGAHFACSSYVSPELQAEARQAAQAGLVVLAEAGLDPGIDHLLAHKLVDQARAAVGDGPAVVRFTSHCGGVPAEPNAFRYRFSWAPRGVLNALRSPARYIEDGAERRTDEPWEHTRPLSLDGEPFEVYPNRDSLPFIDQYRLPATWRPDTFVRGTLRLDGWLQAWAPVFAELRSGDQDRLGALADDLAARHPMRPTDRDRVLLTVALDITTDDGRHWSGGHHLDLIGDESERAMARCVSLPLAIGITDILAARSAPGLNRAAEEPEAVNRWLAQLRTHGLDCHPTVPATT